MPKEFDPANVLVSDMFMRTGDTELAARAAGGDRAAFEALLERHYDTIYRIAYRYTGLREDAEDIAQEICTALADKLRSFKGEAQFTTWLYRIVVNASRDLLRKKATTRRLSELYRDHLDDRHAQEAARAEEIAWLYQALDLVGPDLRDTVVLVLAQGLTHGEAAEVLGVKESTVSWRMHELKRKLKALVEFDK